MGKYDIDIDDNSVWVTATPPDSEVSMPFYITEIGHFYAGENYVTHRAGHDSFMLLYTVSGSGSLKTDGFEGELKEGDAVIFDCHSPHFYKSVMKWDFFWIHINGTGVSGMADAVNAGGIKAVHISDKPGFCSVMERIIQTAKRSDIRSLSRISTDIHLIFNSMIEDSIESGCGYGGGRREEEIEKAVKFIENNYAEAISVEDITNHIHISKYYFIRMFRRYMGITPYGYLINYRINKSKILLRTENISVGEISRLTGFSDLSNFINQFKKQTGQKPMEYRRRFTKSKTAP